MDVQTLIVMLIVLAAAGYVARRFWRAIRGTSATASSGAGCASGGCGCATSARPDDAAERTISKMR